ncbi:hypothetical protein [Agrobacterium sp. B1(2019)]|nr:hypothetical protein [Agrobacterium sp. B1(2019)]
MWLVLIAIVWDEESVIQTREVMVYAKAVKAIIEGVSERRNR